MHTFGFDIFKIIRFNTRKLLNTIMCILYGFKKIDIPIIMITGTDGKTTTTKIIAHVLNASGYKIACANTLDIQIGDKIAPNNFKKTTADVSDLNNFLKKAIKEKCDFVIIEVSSHAIWYNRIYGLTPSISVITNISREHLDFHGTMENYIKTKAKIFKNPKIGAVINLSDENSIFFAQGNSKKIGYIIDGEQITYWKDDIGILEAKKIDEPKDDNTEIFEINDIRYNLPLSGDFNIKNTLAAICVAKLLNIPDEKIVNAVSTIKPIEGRMEKIYDKEFKIFIDFTVTPKAYEIVLSTLYEMLQKQQQGRLIVLMGSCGDRDKDKRPKIGTIASKYANVIILTNEDPYTEDPHQIIKMIEEGIDYKITKVNEDQLDANSLNVYCKILDREQAIKKVIEIANINDIILFAGKAGETKMMIGKKAIDWNEKKIIEKYLNERIKKN